MAAGRIYLYVRVTNKDIGVHLIAVHVVDGAIGTPEAAQTAVWCD